MTYNGVFNIEKATLIHIYLVDFYDFRKTKNKIFLHRSLLHNLNSQVCVFIKSSVPRQTVAQHSTEPA